MTAQTHANHAEVEPVGAERREQARVDLKLRVRYPRRNAFFHEYTQNISRGGMFIATRQPFEPGTRLMFELDIPGEAELLKIRGEVRWRVQPSDLDGLKTPPQGLECGMGIAFLFESDEEKARFEEAAVAMLTDELGPEVARRLVGPRR